jgi:hypothetical protein
MGFLIDAVARRDFQTLVVTYDALQQMLNLAEIFVRTYYNAGSMQV